ncbi:MAG: ATP-binding protein [Haliscomenobacter sp.]|uniref:ATP-binding protein n=1 Tax=Haliscomenobacter sp. TaxID=2717303 RepID=UPI0029B4CB9E|nr:ATP-binding protein [Haliscomenobacter sp.]MDX2071805.1 ATP-binding protein [Haliscomenobacter sp.]
MKKILHLILTLVVYSTLGAQTLDGDTVLLSTKMFTDERQIILLSDLEGWRFHKGNDPLWSSKNMDASRWAKMKPTELNIQHANQDGRAEGWFRMHFKLDSSFTGIPIGFRKGSWAAIDLYVNGKLLQSYGNTGLGDLYQDDNFYLRLAKPYPAKPGVVYTLALHVVDYKNPLRRNRLKSYEDRQIMLRVVGPGYNQFIKPYTLAALSNNAIVLTASILLSLLLCFFALINKQEKDVKLMALTSVLFLVEFYVGSFFENQSISFIRREVITVYVQPILILSLFTWFNFVLIKILNSKNKKVLLYLLLCLVMGGIIIAFYNVGTAGISITFGNALICIFICISNWKRASGAQRAFVAGILLTLVGFAILLLIELVSARSFYSSEPDLLFLAFPICMVIYVMLRFRENLTEIQNNAQKIIQLSEEKKNQAINQQKILEAEVMRQTEALRKSYTDLQSTQAQLIQSEKLASLGELTAGIAHEIQNPLNFVNNFSEINQELLLEMQEEIEQGNIGEVKTIAQDLLLNESKIQHHGQRAASIVKGMLEHSRTSTGVKEPTDLNALADEYLRLAYHGLRAKDNNFNAKLETHFDLDLPLVSVIPQDIGRVLLNLINNAFYAVTEKAKQGIEGYQPTVTISSQKLENAIEIRVRDNGNGIPEAIRDKIFQPFFTTKPTGQGTGLGLSLAYDIVTKGHGGSLEVRSEVGEGTEFVIRLA